MDKIDRKSGFSCCRCGKYLEEEGAFCSDKCKKEFVLKGADFDEVIEKEEELLN